MLILHEYLECRTLIIEKTKDLELIFQQTFPLVNPFFHLDCYSRNVTEL